ncbi:unnamed protein product [Ilex paraguariensis]|uniref:Uncharacterized protein n=1 Tax=Ilex paraguariensis TaxID=185542 RepID=A0ABC8QQN2_9AQUA
MASSNLMASLAVILVLLAVIAKADDHISPAPSPISDSLCNEVECGKGTCKTAIGSPFNFVCECDAGWKRTRLDNEENLQFLPCIVPNCSLDYSCMPAAPPAPSVPNNSSFFDSCNWIYCGEGAIGSDCARLGIEVSKSSSPSPSDGNSQATSFLPGRFHWISITLISMAMALWK